jgi:hypothetical protein
MDKLKHFAACFILALLFGLIHPIVGALVAAAAGICKEWYDKRHGGEFDWWDIAADGAGIAAAVVIICM